MRVLRLAIPDVLLITTDIHTDHRGSFCESFNLQKLRDEAHITNDFVQDNQIWSHRGVLRGLHYQFVKPQGKLVRCTVGSFIDVAVDMRVSSEYFGQAVTVHLTAQDDRLSQVWVPPGFAHGILTTSDKSLCQYKLTAHQNIGDEYCLAWDDPAVDIAWPKDIPIIVSDKDKHGQSFESLPYFA